MHRALLLTFLLILPSSLSASDKTQREARNLLEQAQCKSDITQLPPFSMKAAIKIENHGELLLGEYRFLWNSPDQWREEISFPGFNQIRVGGPGIGSLKRSLDFEPLRINQLMRALDYGREGVFRSDEKIKDVKDRKVNGLDARCVELAGEASSRQICIDVSTGVIVREAPFVDKEFAPIGTKIFPRYLSYVEHGNTLAEAEITEFKLTDPASPSAFEIPAGAKSQPSCLSPTPGRLIKRVSPIYPPLARQSRQQGTVYMYALIGTDGKLSNLRVIAEASPILNSAALDAVRQWRYTPYMCNGIPVEAESLIEVNFTLGGSDSFNNRGEN
jgi:TonB family protein